MFVYELSACGFESRSCQFSIILNCCKLQIVSKKKTRLCNNFHFKDRIPKDLTSAVVYKFQCGLDNESYCGECVRHLNVRIGEHIGISPLTKK